MKLLVVLVLLGAAIDTEAAGCSSLVNVAKGKTTSMTSIYSTTTPSSNCVDGNTDQQWKDNSCTSTKSAVNPWFKVDLGAKYKVHAVIVTNRQDCCQDRLETAEIRVGMSSVISNNTKCGESVTAADIYKGAIVFNCSKPVEGQYVGLQLKQTNQLNFCEIEVMAEGADTNSSACAALFNVAVGKNATMSSQYKDGAASRSLDGNTDQYYNDNSCSHTNAEANAWFKVDLAAIYTVHTVIVTNRQDCCQDRLLNAEVRVGTSGNISNNTKCGASVTSADYYKGAIEFKCSSPVEGQYVSLQLADKTNNLNFCELKVMAEVKNVAASGTASQVSTHEGASPSRTVDGVSDSGNGSHCSQTEKGENAWWKLDLNDTYIIYQVTVTNRAGSFGNQLDGAVVLIGNNENVGNNKQCGGQVDMTRNAYDAKIPFQCSLSGRYVVVMLKDHTNHLNLCGVEVYGSKA